MAEPTELDKLITARKPMDVLYAFISWAKYDGGDMDRAKIPAWEDELKPLEELFYPEPIQTIGTSYFERLTGPKPFKR